jgi:hypothetical protein
MIATWRGRLVRFRSRALACIVASWALVTSAWAGDVVAVVHASNATTEISVHRLRLLYGLYQRTWPGGVRVALLLPESGSPAMDFLVDTVFRMGEEFELERYYLQAVFQQRVARRPRELAAEAAIALVRREPGAIVLVDRDRIGDEEGLRVLAIDVD